MVYFLKTETTCNNEICDVDTELMMAVIRCNCFVLIYNCNLLQILSVVADGVSRELHYIISNFTLYYDNIILSDNLWNTINAQHLQITQLKWQAHGLVIFKFVAVQDGMLVTQHLANALLLLLLLVVVVVLLLLLYDRYITQDLWHSPSVVYLAKSGK